jgi:hypothetical protein
VGQGWGAGVLGLTFLLFAGCGPTRQEAEARRVLVDVGMTGQDVVRTLGRPSRVFPLEPAAGVADQTVEVWAYTIKPPPDLGDVADFALTAGALVVFCVASEGRSTGGVGSLRIRGKARCSFWVGFGPDGRVRGVTNLEETR